MGLRKILDLTSFPPRSGGAHFTNLEAINYVMSQGIEVEVIAEPKEGDAEFDRMYRRQKGVDVHRLPLMPSSASTLPPEEEVRTVSEYLHGFLTERSQAGTLPDLAVIGHEKFAWYSRLFKELGLPVVQHVMGTPTNLILAGIFSPPVAEKYLGSLARADHIVCIAHHFKELLLHLLPNWTADRVSVIHNEIDVAHFSPGSPHPDLRSRLGLPSDGRVIVHASYLRPVKRVKDIVESVPAVLRDRPDTYYVVIGGPSRPTDEEHIRGIVSLMDASGCADHVRMPGEVKPDALPRYLRQGSIFIMSSEAEGLPRAAMEAQACGLYLITSDCPGGRELAGDGALGSVYPVGDVAGLARTTLEVLNMARAKFDAIRAAARDRIVAEYAKGTQLGGYLAILKQVYDGGPA